MRRELLYPSSQCLLQINGFALGLSFQLGIHICIYTSPGVFAINCHAIDEDIFV